MNSAPLLLSSIFGFAPSLLQTNTHCSRVPSVRMVEPSFFDPGLFTSASDTVDFGTFGRAGTFGLITYSALRLVDSPSRMITRRRAELMSRTDEIAQEFGWINADMSVPLPSLGELKDACHRIGVKDGSTFYLCGQPSQEYSCAQSPDFSEYYGETVYVCRHG